MYIAHITHDGKVQSCADHCKNTAEFSGNALKEVNLFATAYLAGLIHDMGKFTDEFLDYIKNAANGTARKGSVIHSFAAVSYMLENFHSSFNSESGVSFRDIAAEAIAIAVGSHHGMMDCYAIDGTNGFEHRLKKQPQYDCRARTAFLRECTGAKELNELFDQAEEEVTSKLDQLAQIASPDDASETYFYSGLLVRLLTSAVVEGDRRDTAAFMSGNNAAVIPDTRQTWKICSHNIADCLSKFPHHTQLQQARMVLSDSVLTAAQRPSGIYRLDLPTGGGKTITALRYAVEHAKLHNKRRIFYIAPLLSIIEQNAQVIRKAVGPDIPVLEHHSNVLHDPSLNDELASSELLQETWDSPIIITTLVRMLDTFFSGKMSDVRRFSALCNSVIIFDEIQSLPPKIMSMFDLTINFLTKCCGATIVLCSATQPALEKAPHAVHVDTQGLIPAKLLDQYATLFKRTDIIDSGSMKLDDMPEYIKRIIGHTNSILVICNMKREATMLYEACDFPGIRRFHLSAGMCMAHRRKVLSEINDALHRNEKTICISTQVIEAGIDISFEEVIRFSAGLDNIVQAAGRCNRNGESDTPLPVHIVRIADEKLGRLREIAEAQLALNELLAVYKRDPQYFDSGLDSFGASSYYYSCLYKNMKQGYMDFALPGGTSIYDLLSENVVARSLNSRYYNCFYQQAFKEAGDIFNVFDEEPVSVIVPYEKGEEIIASLESNRSRYDLTYVKGLIEQAKPYTASIFNDTFKKIVNEGGIRVICENSLYVLSPMWYDKDIGIIDKIKEKEEAAEWNTLIL